MSNGNEKVNVDIFNIYYNRKIVKKFSVNKNIDDSIYEIRHCIRNNDKLNYFNLSSNDIEDKKHFYSLKYVHNNSQLDNLYQDIEKLIEVKLKVKNLKFNILLKCILNKNNIDTILNNCLGDNTKHQYSKLINKVLENLDVMDKTFNEILVLFNDISNITDDEVQNWFLIKEALSIFGYYRYQLFHTSLSYLIDTLNFDDLTTFLKNDYNISNDEVIKQIKKCLIYMLKQIIDNNNSGFFEIEKNNNGVKIENYYTKDSKYNTYNVYKNRFVDSLQNALNEQFSENNFTLDDNIINFFHKNQLGISSKVIMKEFKKLFYNTEYIDVNDHKSNIINDFKKYDVLLNELSLDKKKNFLLSLKNNRLSYKNDNCYSLINISNTKINVPALTLFNNKEIILYTLSIDNKLYDDNAVWLWTKIIFQLGINFVKNKFIIKLDDNNII